MPNARFSANISEPDLCTHQDAEAPHAPLFEALVGPLVGGQFYELSSLQRPGNTFRVTVTLPTDAARLSCLAGLMPHGVVG